MLRDLIPRNAHVSLTVYLPSGDTCGLDDVMIVFVNELSFECERQDQSGCKEMSGIPNPSADRECSCKSEEEAFPYLVDFPDVFLFHG